MILIKAENRELTLSISINQRNPSHEPEDPRHGVLLGTDFRHAVEFSRSGRARTPAFRPSFEAAFPRYATRRDGQAPVSVTLAVPRRAATLGTTGCPRDAFPRPPDC